MNINEQIRKSAEMRIALQVEMQSACILQTCLNCEHWSQNGCPPKMDNPPKCNYYDALPPPDVLVNGCAMHCFDIPF